jgi:hypothetical protein
MRVKAIGDRRQLAQSAGVFSLQPCYGHFHVLLPDPLIFDRPFSVEHRAHDRHEEAFMRVKLLSVLASLLALFAVGCTTTGAGQGTLRDGVDGRVTFQWRSRDSVSGTMTATFADGRSFSGTYFQITSDTRVDQLAPLWDGWHRPWRGWPHWHPDPGPRFVKHYSGRVLANLRADDGEYMRCRFRLVRPSAGMAGGGAGTCQLADGTTIDATFPGA